MLEHGMPIFLNLLKGKTLVFMVQPSTKMKDFKAVIHGREGIEIRLQRLIFLGKELEDEKTFAECEVRKKATIHLVLRQ